MKCIVRFIEGLPGELGNREILSFFQRGISTINVDIGKTVSGNFKVYFSFGEKERKCKPFFKT